MIGKEKGTICSHGNADDLGIEKSSYLDKYAIDKELQHTDETIYYVAHCTWQKS